MAIKQKSELRIFTPVGMFGYGFDEGIFWDTVREGVDAIIVDSGSTDSGPSKLALGTMSCPVEAYTREFELFLAAAHQFKVPVIIGSAGGDGTNEHVDLFVSIVEEIVTRRKFRSMSVVKIYADVDKAIVHQRFAKGLVQPCGQAAPALKSEDIDDPSRIVAQMGLEPYLKAMKEHPDFDIIIGGRSYDPSPYAAFCVHNGFNDLGSVYHMGKIMECGGLCAVPKSREAVAVVRQDSFDIYSPRPSSKCTALSVGAHTLYEKTRPDILKGPGGTLYLDQTTYEELADGKTVRVRGAQFISDLPSEYTVKLEAARTAGFHSMFFGGFADPILIAQIDHLLDAVKAHVSSLCKFEYSLKLTTYGKNDSISMFPGSQNNFSNPSTMAICGEAQAGTQEQANQVINTARVACMHGPYPGQKATSGNFGMVCAPFDIPMGQVCEFCIYHIMPADPLSLFPISTLVVQGTGEAILDQVAPKSNKAPNATSNGLRKVANGATDNPKSMLEPAPQQGQAYLGDLASVIRSKNAGPFELTFDIMFDSRTEYDQVRDSGVLSTATLSKLYHIDKKDILAALWWEPAMAYKFTVKRPQVSGSFGGTDTHGSCQHVRLMYLQIPV